MKNIIIEKTNLNKILNIYHDLDTEIDWATSYHKNCELSTENQCFTFSFWDLEKNELLITGFYSYNEIMGNEITILLNESEYQWQPENFDKIFK